MIILLLMIAILLMLRCCMGQVDSPLNSGFIQFDESAQDGNLPGKTEDEIIEDLNRIVKKGMFNISITPEIKFYDGESKGPAMIENIAANHYNMQVSIILDETGEEIYSSGAIKPGQFIEKIFLSKDLEKGSYSATAVFTALEQETMKDAGRASAIISININN